MSTHSQVAAKVRAEKEAHPERFCSDARCLWRTHPELYSYKPIRWRETTPCPKHRRNA
jgi:hypothetical protein